MTFLGSLDPEIYEGGHKWRAIADHDVVFLQLSKRLGIELPVKCKIHIDRHGQGPVCVRRHEPRRNLQQLKYSSEEHTHI